MSHNGVIFRFFWKCLGVQSIEGHVYIVCKVNTLSKTITLAYQVADIFSRYLTIHNEIFKFSVRKSLLIPGTRKKVDYAAYRDDLAKIQNDLIATQSAIADLRDDDTKRLGKEIRIAMQEYTNALYGAVSQLHVICGRIHNESEKTGTVNSHLESRYKVDLLAYDDSIQKYRRLGKQLNDLFSSF